MLGPLNILYFIDNNPELVKKVFLLSVDTRQNFPFMVASFNLTKSSMDCLREEKINEIVVQSKDLFEAFNHFYMALFTRLYEKWKEENLNITNFHSSLSQIVIQSKKNSLTFTKKYCYQM
mmetsp:Transcript_19763/g.18811  ORF Transcript_19763/g.18811 Transcript_19763/m.18811 type:complete len:120 (+) Transcript_19763:1407-1766(+)